MKFFTSYFFSWHRSTDTEDYMKIELATNQTACPEPPRPPPLPPPMAALNTNGDANGLNSKTNTLNSTANGNIPAPPPPQDTATRKQQQPLSAISIQDLNSVQVCELEMEMAEAKCQKLFFNEKYFILPFSFVAPKIKSYRKPIQRRQHEVKVCSVYHRPTKHFYRKR